ncbi:MAG: TetR/AcrR family transcriptional regulator [Candidatus Hodarchaeales archaeon]|jgi:AcrR family transcriptional regulator
MPEAESNAEDEEFVEQAEKQSKSATQELYSEYRDEYRKKMRQNILDAAVDLFAENSHNGKKYDNVKAEDIADRAEVSRATIYNYFSSRHEFYFEIGIQGLEKVHERYSAQISSDASGLDQALGICEAELREIIKRPFYHEMWRHFTLLNKEETFSEEEIQKKMDEGEEMDRLSEIRASFASEIQKYADLWKTAIEKGLKDQSIHSELTASQLMHYLWLIISGVFDQYNLKRGFLEDMDLSKEQVIGLTISLIRNLLTERRAV